MNKFLKATAVGLFFSASTALALPDSAFYVGGLLGDASFEVRAKTYDTTDDPGKTYETDDSQSFAMLVTGGMRFTDSVGIELQYVTTVIPDKVFGAIRKNGEATSPLELSMNAMGLYGFFQGGEDAFFKARVGFAQTTALFESDYAKESYSTPNLSYGISIGQKMGSLGALELIYMHYPKVDLDSPGFKQAFSSSNPGFDDRTEVEDRLRAQLIALGYVFQF